MLLDPLLGIRACDEVCDVKGTLYEVWGVWTFVLGVEVTPGSQEANKIGQSLENILKPSMFLTGVNSVLSFVHFSADSPKASSAMAL